MNRRLNPRYLTDQEVDSLKHALAMIGSIISCALILTIAGCQKTSFAAEVVIDMDKIAQIESSGCKHKVGDDGDSTGCHQVSSGTLKEYNQFNHTKYTQKDLMNDAISLKIAKWYMNVRIPQMLKHFGKPDNVTNRLWAYNAGIGRVVQGVMPAKTKAYLTKYNAK